jgi:uridine kinase
LSVDVPAIVVGVAGGSGSGKTTVVERLVERLCNRRGRDTAAVIAHDRYYRDQSAVPPHERASLNYDHPDALETELLVSHLQSLRAGLAVDVPIYDFSRHAREPRMDRIAPRPVILVEGVLILTDLRLRDLMDLRVFVHTDDETRFARRLKRDVTERGRTVESVKAQYEATVLPMHVEYVEPSRRHADLVVTEGGFNDQGIERVAEEVVKLLGMWR